MTPLCFITNTDSSSAVKTNSHHQSQCQSDTWWPKGRTTCCLTWRCILQNLVCSVKVAAEPQTHNTEPVQNIWKNKRWTNWQEVSLYLQHQIQRSGDVGLLWKTLRMRRWVRNSEKRRRRRFYYLWSLPSSPAGRRTERGVWRWTSCCSESWRSLNKTQFTTTHWHMKNPEEVKCWFTHFTQFHTEEV